MQLTEHHAATLASGCEQLGLNLSASQLHTIRRYLENLLKWNQAYNLTAIRDPDDMVIKHLLDSLSIVPHVRGRNILDVGTGPGLPGVPAAVCDPGQRWTLIDSNGKKTRFLVQMKAELKLDNVTVLKGRIESVPTNQCYDTITSRAFSSLQNFVSVCLPLLEPEGELLAMKGQIPHDEVAALQDQGLHIRVEPLNVPYLHEERHLIVVKRAQTE
ncbi:MAG: 16S rRNA (guanine(527)-N(7))-methyltransferase RsmG [Alcanivorax sp.]|nr:16S rRNA (guanine(527)-N(7))-methyltransferase RsmG [Pseudomonadales bacterium]TNC85963.1 MAG: 16S rRNA (guanine(527)-N(7))-methyltransferase RsmG [Alcanivorax sp.]